MTFPVKFILSFDTIKEKSIKDFKQLDEVRTFETLIVHKAEKITGSVIRIIRILISYKQPTKKKCLYSTTNSKNKKQEQIFNHSFQLKLRYDKDYLYDIWTNYELKLKVLQYQNIKKLIKALQY